AVGELGMGLRVRGDRVSDREVEVDGRDVDGHRSEVKDGAIRVLDAGGKVVATIMLPEHDGAKHEITVHAQAGGGARNTLESRAAREERVARAAARNAQ